MNDRIEIRGLRIFAYHGVFPEEQQTGQIFIVDVAARIDLADAGKSDALTDTLDYGSLAGAIQERVQSERWDLIERVAQRVADLVLEDGRVAEVEVTVRKPEAPIPVAFDEVAVTITRSR